MLNGVPCTHVIYRMMSLKHQQSYLLLNHGNDLESSVDIVCDSVSHQLEFTIRWDEGDGSVGVEFTKSDASVESTIVQLNALLLPLLIVLHVQFIVEAEFTLRHSGQESLHLDMTNLRESAFVAAKSDIYIQIPQPKNMYSIWQQQTIHQRHVKFNVCIK